RYRRRQLTVGCGRVGFQGGRRRPGLNFMSVRWTVASGGVHAPLATTTSTSEIRQRPRAVNEAAPGVSPLPPRSTEPRSSQVRYRPSSFWCPRKKERPGLCNSPKASYQSGRTDPTAPISPCLRSSTERLATPCHLTLLWERSGHGTARRFVTPAL